MLCCLIQGMEIMNITGVKRVILLVLFILCIPNYSMAKVISDYTGSITFETSNRWYLTSLGEDYLTYELISIVLDNNTGIKITQSKFYTKYKNFNQASDTEKSELRDYIIRYYINLFKSKGYTCTLNKAEYFKNSIKMGFTVKKNNFIGKMATGSYIKDYVAYNVVVFCSDETAIEAMNTLNTLRIDGLKLEEWMGQ